MAVQARALTRRVAAQEEGDAGAVVGALEERRVGAAGEVACLERTGHGSSLLSQVPVEHAVALVLRRDLVRRRLPEYDQRVVEAGIDRQAVEGELLRLSERDRLRVRVLLHAHEEAAPLVRGLLERLAEPARVCERPASANEAGRSRPKASPPS